MSFSEKVKSFAMTNMLVEADLEKIERRFAISLRDSADSSFSQVEIENSYFPQFEEHLRAEASIMAKNYELFYCLEKTIRKQISELLFAEKGSDWWRDPIIPQQIYVDVKKRMQRERESGITPRSSDAIDYTNFGELGEIIKSNWSIFGSVFNNIKAVEKVMFSLNSLRNPIAHCTALADDEKLRLELSLRDWFRLTE